MNPETDYKKLDWDSSFFGILTGMITSNIRGDGELENILKLMKAEGYRLVYYPAIEKIQNETIPGFYEGILADEKVTFVKALEKSGSFLPDSHITSYTGPEVTPELLELAWESGVYSRFNVDPHFNNEEYKHLYKTWIERSVSREIAKDVLVYIDGVTNVGMITLGEKNRRGDIGLAAVASSARGKGIGKKLVSNAEYAFSKMGYTQVQVVTQGINSPAMKLYESSGYTINERLFYYHFWL